MGHSEWRGSGHSHSMSILLMRLSSVLIIVIFCYEGKAILKEVFEPLAFKLRKMLQFVC